MKSKYKFQLTVIVESSSKRSAVNRINRLIRRETSRYVTGIDITRLVIKGKIT